MITLSGKNLIELLDFISPDREQDPSQLDAEITIIKRDAFTSQDGESMPAGLYAYDAEYPSEGLHGPIGMHDPMPVSMYSMEDGEPWGVWVDGHRPKADFLECANKIIEQSRYAPVTVDQVEHGYARYDHDIPEYNLMESTQEQLGAFPITWIRGENINYVE